MAKSERRRDSLSVPARLLGAWLCHELAAPLTALGQGLELLPQSSAKEREEILRLLQEGSAALDARFRALQRLFAVSPPDETEGGFSDSLVALAASHKIALRCEGVENLPVRHRGILAFLAFAALSGLKPPSSLKISCVKSAKSWRVQASASGCERKRVSASRRFFEKPSPPPSSLSPSDAPLYLLGEKARLEGAPLRLLHEGGVSAFVIEIPL